MFSGEKYPLQPKLPIDFNAASRGNVRPSPKPWPPLRSPSSWPAWWDLPPEVCPRPKRKPPGMRWSMAIDHRPVNVGNGERSQYEFRFMFECWVGVRDDTKDLFQGCLLNEWWDSTIHLEHFGPFPTSGYSFWCSINLLPQSILRSAFCQNLSSTHHFIIFGKAQTHVAKNTVPDLMIWD